MSRLLLLCILLIGCRPKNKLSSEGLKVGEWKEQVNDSLTEIGEYKIISIANYDTIRHLGESWIEVRYRKSTPLLFYNSRSSNNISVRHGLWQLINSNGKVYEEKFWNLGLSDSSKYYNEDGSINFFEYDDYETDTSFYLTYKDNRLLRKHFIHQKIKTIKQKFTTLIIIYIFQIVKFTFRVFIIVPKSRVTR